MHKKVLLCFLPISLLCLSACGTQQYEYKDYGLKLNFRENFKILQLNDIHLANKDDAERQLKHLQKLVDWANKDNKVDLIVLDGDVFTFAEKTTVYRVFNWLDSTKINWTLTFGNHDEQGYYPITWVTSTLNALNEKRLSKNESYCVFKDCQYDGVTGNANFYINLMEGDVAKYQVIVMDSNRYNFGSYIGYDWIKDNQVDWYRDVVTKSKVGANYVPNVMFFHIPIPEFKLAKENATQTGNWVVKNYGPGEGIASPKMESSELYKAMKEYGATKGIFVAHDHENNWATMYEDILFSFGVNSTDRIYYADGLIGCQTITIKNDLSLELHQAFHANYESEEVIQYV